MSINNKRKKMNMNMLLVLIFFVLLIFLLLYLIYSKIYVKEIYSIDSRVDNIKEEKKKDDSDYYKTVGWLRVQGTNIDTPIIGYNYEKIEEDKNYNFDIENKNYLWNDINDEKLYNKVNINGHNILNLSAKPDSGLKYFSRFDDLMSFVYYDFVKDNKYIQYTVNGKDYIYKIYAVNFSYPYDANIKNMESTPKNEIEEEITRNIKSSIFKFNVDVTKEDKLISLVTCTRMFTDDEQKQFVLNARMLRDGEKTNNYRVVKTDNYKEIENKLKGDVENEKA